MAPALLRSPWLGGAALLAAAATAAARPMTLQLLDTKRHASALCNDGSPAGMYLSLSTTGSNVWVVWQEGGGLCTDKASCEARSAAQKGSGTYKPTLDAAGLFDAADERLASANFAYVRYCSSDSWTGDVPAAAVPFGFNFLGSRIVEAVFATLMEEHGLGGAPGTQVLYTGCSAGSRGVLFNADAVGAQLAANSNVTTFKAFVDSGFYIDIEPYVASKPSLMTQMAEAVAMTHAGGRAGAACASAYPAEIWKCFFGQYVLPYVKTPVMTQSFLYDLFQLGEDGLPKGPTDAPSRAYCEAFRNDTSFWLKRDTPTGPGLDQAVFAPACFHHCCTDSSVWHTLNVGGVAVEKALTSWFFGDASVPAYLQDTCAGFNCGAGCPAR